jgi:hypothetical protein
MIERKKNDRIKEVPVLMEYNKNMELIIEESYKIGNDKEMDIKEIMLLLNMTEGLPQS